jgi:hypothetical protein
MIPTSGSSGADEFGRVDLASASLDGLDLHRAL